MEHIIERGMLDLFRSRLIDDEKSEATLEKYTRDVEAFIRYVGIGSVITKDVTLHYKKHLIKKYAVTSANSMLAALNRFFREMGWLDCIVKSFKVQREAFRSKERELSKVEIDIGEIIALFWNHALWIIGAAVGMGLVCFLICTFCLTPRYEASINMIVNTRQDTTATVTNDNINSAKSLASTYAIVIKSNTVLDEVIQTLGLDMTYRELSENIDVESVDSTQIIKITVQNEDPELAGLITQTIATVAPDVLVETVEAGSCKIVSKVEIDYNPVYPRTKRYTVMFAALGMFAACGIIFVLHLLHNYIEDDEDVQKKLELPVLGLIPEI